MGACWVLGRWGNLQTARLKRHRKVADVLNSYPDDVQAVPAFADIAQELQARLALVGGIPARRTSKGATEQKSQLRDHLEARLLKAANALYLLYRKEGDLEAARTLYRKASEYTRLNALALARVAADLSAATAARTKYLAPYNLDAAAVQALATAAQAYNESIDRPKTSIEASKATTATTQLLQDLDRYLKDDFYSAAMQLLPDSHPQLFALLQEAIRVDNAGSRPKPAPIPAQL